MNHNETEGTVKRPSIVEGRFLSKNTLWMVLVMGVVLVLAACASQGGGDPAKIVEQYLTAKVAGDKDTISKLLCSSMEANLNQEAQSFSSMQVALKDMSCQRDGDTDVVRCSGSIVATYGTENTSFPLGAYHVTQEDGEWKWCGEAR